MAAARNTRDTHDAPRIDCHLYLKVRFPVNSLSYSSEFVSRLVFLFSFFFFEICVAYLFLSVESFVYLFWTGAVDTFGVPTDI